MQPTAVCLRVNEPAIPFNPRQWWERSPCPSALWLVQFVCGVLCPRLHLLLHFLAGAVCRIGERPNRGGTSLVHDEWAQSHCPLSACLLALTTLSYGCFGSFPIRC